MTARRECFVHIGHTKTGSTSIQNAFGAHREALAARGVCYPRTPGWGNHALLPAAMAPPEQRERGVHPGFWGGLPPALRIERFLEEFPAEMAALPPETRLVVLSSEQCIHMLPDVAAVTRLRDFLAPHFARVRIVVYLRRQDEHVASAYTQLLRDGVIDTPRLPEGGPRQLPHYDYAGLLWRWARVFGQDGVVPRLFERGSLVNGDAIDDFLALCGAQGAVPADDPNRASNPSADTEGQGLMVAVGRAMARVLPGRRASLGDPVWRHFTELVTEAMPGRGWRPGRAEAQEFLARFRDGNEWIRQRWFPDRPSLFTQDFERLPEKSGLPEGPALLDAAMGLLAKLAERSLREEVSQLLALARIEQQQGRIPAALRLLNMAVQADEHAPAPRLLLAELLGARGKRELARQHLAAAAAKLPAEDAELARVTAALDSAGPQGAAGAAPREA